MEFYKNLLINSKRNKFAIIFGSVTIVFALSWIPLKILDSNLRPFDWLYASIFLLNGILSFMYGFGYQFEQFFFKAFVRINDKIISVKAGALDKKQEILWDDIKEIEYKPSKFIIEMNDSSIVVLSLSKLDYSTNQQVKKVVNEIAKNKKIAFKHPIDILEKNIPSFQNFN